MFIVPLVIILLSTKRSMAYGEYDLSIYGAQNYPANSSLYGNYGEYEGDSFWRHRYWNDTCNCYNNNNALNINTHSGRDYNVNGVRGVVKSYGFGKLLSSGTDSYHTVSIQNLLNSGDVVNFNLLHMRTIDSLISNSNQFPVVKRQILGVEGGQGPSGPDTYAEHLHLEVSDSVSLAWLRTDSAYPCENNLASCENRRRTNHDALKKDSLEPHYANTKSGTPSSVYYHPGRVAEYSELIPYISDTTNPSPLQYKVFGYAGKPLYSSLRLKRTFEKDFHSIGILVGNDHERIDNNINYLALDNGKWLAASWNLDSDGNGIPDTDWGNSNNTTTVQGDNNETVYTGNFSYPAGDYLCRAAVSSTGTSDNRGYPVTFTVLPNSDSKIVDNDQLNEENASVYTDAMGTANNYNTVPGYFLTAKLVSGMSGASANWKPYLQGDYEVYVYVPTGATATNVVYKIKPDGTDSSQILSEGVDQTKTENQNNWVKLKGVNGSTIFNFTRNGYVGLALTSGSNPGISATAKAAFDAIKFEKIVAIYPVLSLLLSAPETPEPPHFGTVISAGQVWMDRNLGASRVATSSTDSAAYGDLYQWGRGADGHQLRTSPTTVTTSATDAPGHGSFIQTDTSPFDWRAPQNNSLWQGVSGANNPCPSGFRLPTETELDTERASWASNDPAGAYTSPLKLVVAGFRFHNDGWLSAAGSSGLYWSSTVNDSSARVLFFYSGYAYVDSYYRALGFSLRCLKD